MTRSIAWIASLLISLPVFAMRDDVLVIVNDNSIDSPVIGQYYARVRGISPENIVHTSTPNSYFINWTQFKVLRDQIIRHMQEKTFVDPKVQAVVCQSGESPYYCQESVDQVRANTRIKYVVTTRGVPTRMVVDGSYLGHPKGPTSVDNYLKYWLVRYFTEDTPLNFTEREIAFADGSGMRIVDTAHDGELIVGRIDGLSVEAAIAQIDRSLQAENNGLFGRIYSTPGSRSWFNSLDMEYVYPPKQSSLGEGWKYQFGIFGEVLPECKTYLDFPGNTPSGKSPAHCTLHINDDPVAGSAAIRNRPPVGFVSSRQPQGGTDAVIYRGWLDGHGMSRDNFDVMLKWRKNDHCHVTLCEYHSDPNACRAASTDVFSEINTDCVGFADGFIAHQLQSFPMSYFTVWPTGYGSAVGGDFAQLAFPEVRNDVGFNDNQSLWFRNTDQVAAPRCFENVGPLDRVPSSPCLDERRVAIKQIVDIEPIDLNAVGPRTFELSLRYMTEKMKKNAHFELRFQAYDDGSNSWVDYGYVMVGKFSLGTSPWLLASSRFTLDPALHSGATISKLSFDIRTKENFIGDLGIDSIRLIDLATHTDYVSNGDFTEGHRQNALGDHAANIISRLNGVAAWGSLGHHESYGGSFMNNMADLVYFFRGLPLGDAVWFDEKRNSGILYGDPLYSPIAIHIKPVNGAHTVMGRTALKGSAINGRDSTLVSTAYRMDYCPGDDFYLCDQSALWKPTGIEARTAVNDGILGTWDASKLSTGPYTLRLAVTSSNHVSGRSQTFNDFYSVQVVSDFDGDGVADIEDNCTTVANGPNTYPSGSTLIQRDSNGDGFGNVCDMDLNNDGIGNVGDLVLLKRFFFQPVDATNPLLADSDLNGDGWVNVGDLLLMRALWFKAPGPARSEPVH